MLSLLLRALFLLKPFQLISWFFYFFFLLGLVVELHTAEKMKFSFKAFFSKCDQICSNLWIWSHILKKFSMENFIFSSVATFLNP